MNRTSSILALAAVGALTVGGATACSSGTTSTSSGAPTTTAGGGGSPTTTAAGQPTSGGIDACSLVTKAEVETMVPNVGDGVAGRSGGGGGSCEWKSSDAGSFLLQVDTGKQYYTGDSPGDAARMTSVPGLGDKNFVMKNGQSFSVVKGDKVFLVTAFSMAKMTDDARLDAAKKLMKSITDKL